MSELTQLEQILGEKVSLEEESQELDQEQKMLRQKVKMLTEKIIQEMRKRNNAKQDTVKKLQSQINELELQLSNLSTADITDKSNSANSKKAEEETLEKAIGEASEDAISVTAVDEEENDEIVMHDKKKRKLF